MWRLCHTLPLLRYVTEGSANSTVLGQKVAVPIVQLFEVPARFLWPKFF